MSDTNKDIARGAAWMVAFKFLDRGIGLLSTIVLARLLVPADFGLIAMAMSLIAALQILFAFGFDVHLIQNRDAGRPEYDTVWTGNVLFGLFMAAALSALAHVMAGFYQEPRLEAVIYALAAGCLVSGFTNVGAVTFRRDMRFDREFKFMMGKRLAPALVTIPIAIYLKSYWALAIGQLTGTLVSVGLSFYMSSYRPRFSLARWSQLFHSSKWLVINNIVAFVNGRAADLSVGKFAGASALGQYTISLEIATLPTTELVAPINRAAFPGYARVAHDLQLLRASFLSVISMIALFAVPAGLGIMAVADLMVPAVLGWKWQAAIPLIQILAVYGVLSSLQTNIGYVYLAVGRPRLITLVSILQLILLVLLLLPGIWYFGVIGAAWACLGTTIVMVPVNQLLISRRLHLSLRGYMGRLWRPIVAGVCMVLAVELCKYAIQPGQATAGLLAALLGSIVVGALAYAVSIYLLWQLSGQPEGAEKTCLQQARQVMHRFNFGMFEKKRL